MSDETHKLQRDPPEGARKVIEKELERAGQAGEAKRKPGTEAEAAQEAPDPMNASRLKSIKPVDLSLHSDGIDHWQDEPQPPDQKKRD